jgi:hypothetical protein
VQLHKFLLFLRFIYHNLVLTEATTAAHALTVSTARGNSLLCHLKLAAAATAAKTLSRTANAAALRAEHVPAPLENRRRNVGATRLCAIVKAAVVTTVKLALTTLNSYIRLRFWKFAKSALWPTTRRSFGSARPALLTKEKF